MIRCPDCGGYKHNPDEDLRRLERAALSGDIHAARQLSLEKHRRGLCEDGKDCWRCQANILHDPASNWDIRNSAVWSIGKTRDPAAISILIETIQNDYDWSVRDRAVRELVRIGGPASIPTLVEAMQNDSSPFVREDAVIALGAIGNPTVITSIAKTMKNDSNFRVREKATEAIKKLRRKIKTSFMIA